MSIGFSHTRHRDELEGAREYDADTYAGHVPDLVNIRVVACKRGYIPQMTEATAASRE